MTDPKQLVETRFKEPKKTKAQRGMYGRGAKAKCLKLHSEIVRSRGRCEYVAPDGTACGDWRNLQTAHIIRRSYAWTASDENDAWCMCAKHHFLIDLHPDEFMGQVVRSIGMAEFKRLKKKALDGVGKKFDWDQELERLKAVWKAMEAA